jgi:hypothetical protein
MNEKIEPLAAFIADAALIGTGVVHLYLLAVLVKARANAARAEGTG